MLFFWLNAYSKFHKINPIRINVVFILFMGWLFCSCSGGENVNFFSSRKNLELSSEKSVTIELSDMASNVFFLSQEEIINNDEYLIFSNSFPTNPNMLFFHNITNPRISFILDFEIEGPEGVGQMSEFYFHNLDSIFIFDRYSYRLSLVDSSGSVKNRYLLTDSDNQTPGENTVLTWVNNTSKIILVDNFLYIPSLPDVDPFDHKYDRKNLLLKLNLVSGEYKLILGYPSKYKSGGYWGGPDHILPSISKTSDPNIIVVSYPVEDSLYTFDLKKEELKAVSLAKSSLLDNINPSSQFSDDRETRLKYQLGTDFYFSIIYDPYRKLYYRFSSQKYSEESIKDILNRKKGAPNNKSLLVLNDNLDVVNEFDLPINSSGYLFFVFRSGVYIVKENSDENKLFLYNISNF